MYRSPFFMPLWALLFAFTHACSNDGKVNTRGISVVKSISSADSGEGHQITIGFDSSNSAQLASVQVDDLQGWVSCDNDPGMPVIHSTFTIFGSPSNCIFKLLAVSYRGTLYIPKIGALFSTHLKGDSGTFVALNGGEIKMTVTQQLPTLISGNAAATYSFIESNVGSTVTTSSGVKINTGTATAVGESAPGLVLKSLRIDYPTPSQTNIVARFECLSPITGTSGNYSCNGDIIKNLRHWAGPTPEILKVSLDFLQGKFSNANPLDTPATTISALNPAPTYYPTGTSGLLNGGLEITYPISSTGFFKTLNDFAGNGVLFSFAQSSKDSFIYSTGSLAQVHLIGIDRGPTPVNGVSTVPVTVNTGTSTVLALLSNSAVTWKLTLGSGTTISRVLLYGNAKPSITGLPGGVTVDTYCQNPLTNGCLAPSADSLMFTTVLGSLPFSTFVRFNMNLAITSVQAADGATSTGFTVPNP